MGKGKEHVRQVGVNGGDSYGGIGVGDGDGGEGPSRRQCTGEVLLP